jgi:hypothetical protein
LKAKLEVE